MIVCLCGSTKYKQEFLEAAKEETRQGNIVLSVGYFGHADDDPPERFEKAKLDLLHLEKVAMADLIYVINVDGYIGESTEREIVHAIKLGKKLEWHDALAGEEYLEKNGASFQDGRWTI